MAIKWFNIAANIDKNCKDAYYGQAICNIKLGKPEEALKSVDEALKNDTLVAESMQ